MTYRQMVIATISGTLYGTLFSFLNDFLIVIMQNINYPYPHLFNSCNLITSILYGSYAYYYIMKEYGWIFLQQNRNLEMILYFGFIFPALIIYPSEFTCAIYNQRADYMFHRIISSPATMISMILMLESSGVHQELIRLFYQ